ncbi:MAG TPA: hypothetical protein VHM23_02995 [Actinomycetota bacterium]|jgi:hypothetical protein|nr:hypothetical protein [Actinomycetota bacterium]
MSSAPPSRRSPAPAPSTRQSTKPSAPLPSTSGAGGRPGTTEVRVTADGPDQTTVQLEHRNLERLVDGQALRDGIVGGGGWPSLLELFAKAATNQR